MNQLVGFLNKYAHLLVTILFLPIGSCYPQSSTNAPKPFPSILFVIITLVILLLVYWKKLFKRSEKIVLSQEITESNNIQPTEKNITLCCSKCSQKYTLGQDALVMTSFGVVDSFRRTTISERDASFINNSNDPDLVGAINGTWDDLEHSTKHSQDVEISRLKSLLSSGRLRWWKCQKCYEVQTYKPF